MSKEWIQIEVCRQANERVAAMMKIEAMKADNNMKLALGIVPDYDEKDFMDVMEAYGFDDKGLNEKKAAFN